MEKIKSIGHDLAHSWYFRVWALIWIILALTVFSGMIILSQNAENAQKQESIQMWIENATEIYFPRFHLRLDPMGNETFRSTPSCVYGNNQLTPTNCAPWHGQNLGMNLCVAYIAENIKIANQFGNFGNNIINCQANTIGAGPDGNMVLAYGLEGNNTATWGGMAFHSTYITPNNMAWVFLEKNVFQMNRHSTQISLWQKILSITPLFPKITFITFPL